MNANPRLITTRQHAVIDYAWSALMPFLPRLLGWNKEATRICDAVATAGAVQSVLTDYEGGVIPVLPMQAHLATDGLLGAALIGIAALDEDQPTAVRASFLGAGVFALFAATMTKPIPEGRGRVHARRTATRVRAIAGETAGRIAGRV